MLDIYILISSSIGSFYLGKWFFKYAVHVYKSEKLISKVKQSLPKKY